MKNVLGKVTSAMEHAAKTPFDSFMEEKVLPQKPYLDKFMHLKT